MESTLNSRKQLSNSGAFNRGVILATVMLGIVLVIVLVAAIRGKTPSLKAARHAYLRGDFAAAESLAARIRDDGISSGRGALILAADAAERQHRYLKVVEYLDQIRDSDPAAEQSRLRAGDVLLAHLQRLSVAEDRFERCLHINPDNVGAHERLGFVLGLGASSWEAIPHRLQLLKHDRFDAVHLYLLCLGESALENAAELPALLHASPDDPRVLLGAARAATDRQDLEEAKRLLEHALVVAPQVVEVHVKLGQLLQETASIDKITEWEKQLPKDADKHPGIWAVRGTWAVHHGQPEVAVRCFLECIERDPVHERGNYQLSQLLLARGELERAQPFLRRSRLLNAYFDAVKIGYTGHDDPAALRAAMIAGELGLYWESAALYRWLQRKRAFPSECDAGLRQLAVDWKTLPLTRGAPNFNLVTAADIERFPLPTWRESADRMPRPAFRAEPEIASSHGTIAFEDQAREVGLSFQYCNGVPLGTTDHCMFEFSGGGVAVLDYDRDGYPDVYLTQGHLWSQKADAGGPTDNLFRNVLGNRFESVTPTCRLHEPGFSQGATVGDFDSDGFDDIYVANIGHNRLFRNNGDGTFTDVTEQTGTAGEDRWSTGAALSDLNGDGNPDLYVINYLSGNDVFERLCPDAGGRPRSCSPRHFAAAQDQFWLNQGDGTFAEATEESGIVVPDGKGLGIVVGDLDHTGRISIFVANDAVPNFFFVNQEPHGSRPRFIEQAMLSGLAVDRDGRSQACMGVAAGDPNGDGLLDLFVTNFYNESNTYYRQISGGVFEDATRAAQLYDVSLKMVGFGTQFLDIDLDGRQDLVIANGDVDDLRDVGRDHAQRPQCLWNRGHGVFEEVRTSTAGSYFQAKCLGRGLARVDWNRDGREDVVVSHLDRPAALLTNRSEAGHFVSLRLVGTKSARIPIGATVVIQLGTARHVRQLTAGDGYMASNERQLTFGLGTQSQVDLVEIRWPSGEITELSQLEVDREYTVVEGRARAIELH